MRHVWSIFTVLFSLLKLCVFYFLCHIPTICLSPSPSLSIYLSLSVSLSPSLSLFFAYFFRTIAITILHFIVYQQN